MSLPPSWVNHQRRAIEADGTVHAARYACDREHFTTACTVYPAPVVERLEPLPTVAVTCVDCIDKLDAAETSEAVS